VHGLEAAIRICDVLEAARMQYVTEAELQAEIAAAFAAAGIDAAREVRLSDGQSRIDLLAGSVGIEVKIGGGRSAVNRQLARYARCDEITALVLVTTRAGHFGRRVETNGKPILTAALIGAGL